MAWRYVDFQERQSVVMDRDWVKWHPEVLVLSYVLGQQAEHLMALSRFPFPGKMDTIPISYV